MPIDYTKRPSEPTPPTGGGSPVSLSKVSLTKAAPTVSLTKHGAANGMLRVNLNWNARPAGGGGGLFRKAAPPLDLDLGCLYEFADGQKGVVQALGNAFSASPRGSSDKVIWLDGDDRSGSNDAGENLFVNLGHLAKIKRILVFALIYEGAANWAAADGVATLFPASGPQFEVRLDDPRDGARICAIAMLANTGNDLSVHREVNYITGTQPALDEAYSWGMRWQTGRK